MEENAFYGYWQDYGRYALLVLAALAVPVWMWMRNHRRAREASVNQRMEELARAMGAELIRDDEYESKAQARIEGRTIKLQQTFVMQASRRGELQILLSTPLSDVDLGYSLRFLDLPRWLPKSMRERPYRVLGKPLPDGWFDTQVRQAATTVRSAGDGYGTLYLEAGELAWKIVLFHNRSNLPTIEEVSHRITAMAHLASLLETRLAMGPAQLG